MFHLNSYIRSNNGERQERLVYTETKEKNGVRAVYIKGFSKYKLDMEFGAGIDVEIIGTESWIADYRHNEWWCSPCFGSSLKDVPDQTQGLIYKKYDGAYGVVLPIVSEKYKCVLVGKEHHVLTAKLFSLYENLNYCDALAYVYAEGNNPFQLVEQCTKYALELLNTGVRMRDERRYPEIFEYLGWCSWDALQIRVNEADIIKECKEFQRLNIPVKWILIDDMWGEVRNFYGQEYETSHEMFFLMHASKLYSFKADPKRFPNGLKHCINAVNELGIKVGIWHPTTGYWAGIDPEGEIYKEYKHDLIQTEDGRYIHSYQHCKAYEFYSAYHDYLRKSGAAFVKIDNQSLCNRFYRKLAPIGEAARGYHNAMEASVGGHFDNAMINCMGMASEDMWNRSVSPILRCSDDFQPEDAGWFAKHILQCSYNDIFQGQLYYCDWDMWWTDDGQALKNSILRAISGGPVYVSDRIGRSNREVLMPLILSDGKVLRCDRPAMPVVDCLTSNPMISGRIFKLQNIANGCGIIAAFNLDENDGEVDGTISPSQVEGLYGKEFVVYNFFTRKATILKYSESTELVLKNRSEVALYIISEIINGFAPIGRIDKFISPATIKSVKNRKIELTEEGPYAYFENGSLHIIE